MEWRPGRRIKTVWGREHKSVTRLKPDNRQGSFNIIIESRGCFKRPLTFVTGGVRNPKPSG